jgi:predicted dehydrogenase
MTATLRAGVVGTGHLGSLHARKYQALNGVELAAVADVDPERARQAAGDDTTPVFSDHRALAEKVDLASVVVPTGLHYEVARDLLNAGVHVLVEKPVTTTLDEARALIELAEQKNLVLQVGHLERFNPAVQALAEYGGEPLFIESHRIAPFNPRGTDVNVILDLMIHDIDLIQQLVKSPLEEIRANGVPVLTDNTDIANARLAFANGCVANVTASRVSQKSQRSMRIFQRDTYFLVDMGEHKLQIRRRGSGESWPGVPDIESEDRELERGDALLAEIESFVDSVQNNREPVVTGTDGLRALEAASEITRLLEDNAPAKPGAPTE